MLLLCQAFGHCWIKCNHYFLLLLTRASIPDDVQTAIKGFKFALNPYQYLSLNSIHVYRLLVDKFKFGVRNNDIETFGIDSDSSIYNTTSFIVFIVIVTAIYVWIWILNKILLNWIPRRRCSWFLKALKWIISNIFELMTFGYFIRTFIEIFQLLLVSSINEIYWFNTSQNLRIVSLVYAILTLTIIIFQCKLFGILQSVCWLRYNFTPLPPVYRDDILTEHLRRLVSYSGNTNLSSTLERVLLPI